VGQVDEARRALAGVASDAPGRLAIEQMIAAVNLEDWTSPGGERRTTGEWMAESYYLQSKSDLHGALQAARRAAEISPEFGYAWTRVAELEFSFGRTREALRALGHGLKLTPRNAQAHALRGFLLSAQNNITTAREAFNEAIRLDGALGNGWLGRGLTYIRQGKDEQGRHDLQVAATVEPNRSILHAYLGKAFSEVGDSLSAQRDLQRARELDPLDPTPWLYSAIESKQENRYNAAVTDLEKSLELHKNRRVYRSEFLLDQDRAVRSTNLAAIYLNNGMRDVSVREAIRAVNSDYSSASAHLFLSNSFDALRDPRRILLRYETAWSNEFIALESPRARGRRIAFAVHLAAGVLEALRSRWAWGELGDRLFQLRRAAPDGLAIRHFWEYQLRARRRILIQQRPAPQQRDQPVRELRDLQVSAHPAGHTLFQSEVSRSPNWRRLPALR
jgi:tetratricopeptide (TPR) repeat protein